MERMKFFTILPYCPDSQDPDCCAPPGLSQEEVNRLVEAMENAGWSVEVSDIRDFRVVDAFPEAARLFKEYRYDALPIITLDREVLVYGIPDEKFIISSVKKKLSNSIL